MIYISSLFRSLQKVSVHTCAPHLADGRGIVTGITVPFDIGTHGIISHVRNFFYSPSQLFPAFLSQVAVDIAHLTDFTVLTSAVFTTINGPVHVWQQDKEH